MEEATLQLFRTLTELQGAPGHEKHIRAFMESQMKLYTDEIVRDRLGSLFGVLRGDEQGPRIMVAGHMDEVGFMVTTITDNGMVKFQTLGGWWNQTMLAQRVQIMTEAGPVIGVIGSVPPHLLDETARSKPTDVKSMYIDIGADDRADAVAIGIKPGQQIVPICPFTPMANPKKIMAKSWDNRYGVGLALELLKETHRDPLPNVVYAGATVQEEVGLRGARTAAALIQPDLFFALDASPANDSSGDKTAFGQLGKGALLRVFDPTMITHRGLIEYVQDTADTEKIAYQYFFSSGGTDAGQVHLSGIGVPSAVIGICSRYIHTAASIIHVDDYAAAKQLLVTLVRKMDRTTFNTIIENS